MRVAGEQEACKRERARGCAGARSERQGREQRGRGAGGGERRGSAALSRRAERCVCASRPGGARAA
eukprot:673162-Prymnesium_polylepis.1